MDDSDEEYCSLIQIFPRLGLTSKKGFAKSQIRRDFYEAHTCIYVRTYKYLRNTINKD